MTQDRTNASKSKDADGSPASRNDRKLRILDAAERLFSISSYEGVSIRDVASEAGVNSALIGYYFGAKEDLYRALFDRRYHGITESRVQALSSAALNAQSVDSLRWLIRAWIAPLLELLNDARSRSFIILLAREAGNPSEDKHGVFRDYLDPSAKICLNAMQKVFPEASRRHLAQAYLWMVAAVMSSITSSAREARLGGARGPKSNTSADLAQRLESFCTSGMWALLHE